VYYAYSARAWLALADSAAARSDYVAAHDLAGRVAASRPRSGAGEAARRKLPGMRREADAQTLLREGERLEGEGKLEEAGRVYARVMAEYRDCRQAPVAYQRQQALRVSEAARNACEAARRLEEQARYLEAVVLYAETAAAYPMTSYGERAHEREAVCRSAAPLLDAFERHRARGEMKVALEDLDGLLALDVPRAPLYAKRAKVHEVSLQWTEAAADWREADRLAPSAEAKKRAAMCDDRAAHPMIVRNLAARREPRTGETVLSGELVNSTPKERRDVEIEVRFYAEDSPAEDARPVAIVSHVVKGAVPPGGRHAFAVNVGIIPRAATIEGKVTGP
jgi:tetratricopeptide (TPR) repeat protein